MWKNVLHFFNDFNSCKPRLTLPLQSTLKHKHVLCVRVHVCACVCVCVCVCLVELNPQCWFLYLTGGITALLRGVQGGEGEGGIQMHSVQK